ncbi:MAG: STAS domain-containing protein [Gemmataceae bacterium]|nr:STAS domain-containing protein [Gemmataceae bacterium]MDW8266325.1 STAS domain-containing protein [Gemmataceae bacterium]
MPPTSESRWISHEPNGDVLIVRLRRKHLLDAEEVAALGNHLLDLVEDRGRTKLLLDLEQVERMATDLLTKLVTVHRRAEAAGGRLAICGLKQPFLELLAALNLAGILHTYPTEGAALESF